MTFQRAVWLPVALAIVVINLAGGIYAYLTAEPVHGFVHGAAALGFGLWARHLWSSKPVARPLARSADQEKVELLEADLTQLERELRETQARLDFADQLLKKKPPST
jgi:hypothetical protein